MVPGGACVGGAEPKPSGPPLPSRAHKQTNKKLGLSGTGERKVVLGVLAWVPEWCHSLTGQQSEGYRRHGSVVNESD